MSTKKENHLSFGEPHQDSISKISGPHPEAKPDSWEVKPYATQFLEANTSNSQEKSAHKSV